MSDQQNQNPNPNPYNQAPNQAPNGYAPNGYAQPQQPQQPQYGYAPPPANPYGQQAAYGQPPAPYGYGQPQFAPRHKLPGGALAAAIIWIIYGSLQLIGVLGSLAAVGRPGPQLIIGLGVGVAFLMAGITTSTGKAKGLLANGIVSIVWGAIILLAMLALGSLVRGLGGASSIIMLIGVLLGGMMITAGILACMGNGKYKEYHHTKHGY